jgi:ribosomal protein L7Ae-like RNA K-turn-binding protein
LAIILLKEFRRKDKLRKGKSKRVKALTSKREEAIFIEEEDG